MGDVMQNGGYTIMQTIAIIDLFESVVPGIVWRHRILMSPNNIRKVFAMNGIIEKTAVWRFFYSANVPTDIVMRRIPLLIDFSLFIFALIISPV